MTKNQTLITAAGGNGTAIEILDQALTRQEYESRGKALESDFAADGVEQAGFIIPRWPAASSVETLHAQLQLYCTKGAERATCLSLSLGLPER